jgi:hypothetical protein
VQSPHWRPVKLDSNITVLFFILGIASIARRRPWTAQSFSTRDPCTVPHKLEVHFYLLPFLLSEAAEPNQFWTVERVIPILQPARARPPTPSVAQ